MDNALQNEQNTQNYSAVCVSIGGVVSILRNLTKEEVEQIKKKLLNHYGETRFEKYNDIDRVEIIP